VRVVLDANVLISAALSPRVTPAELIRRWGAGEFELVVSELLLAELERALGYPKLRARISRADALTLVALVRNAAQIAGDAHDPPSRSVDPGDDYLIVLAEAQSAILVSGDDHLLRLADRFPILSPTTFLESLTAAQ
jgi:uncharacterized protein